MLRQFENSGVGREFVKHEISSSDVPITSSANSETKSDSDDTYLQNAIVGSDSLRVNNNKSTGETPIDNSSALDKVNGKSSDISKFQVPDEEAKFSMSQNVQTATQQSNNNTFSSFENQIENYDQDHETQHLPEGSAVPSSRIARAFGFASLGAGLAMGTVAELARRTLRNGSNKNDSLVLSNDANAQRLTNSLRRMRGAAINRRNSKLVRQFLAGTTPLVGDIPAKFLACRFHCFVVNVF
jgi:aarF domain-containing kinase